MKYLLLLILAISLISCSQNNVNTNNSLAETNSGVNLSENGNDNSSSGNNISQDNLIIENNDVEVSNIITKLAKKIEDGNLEDSKKEALEAYKKYPDSAILLNILGNIYLKEGDQKNAILYLEKADKISNGKDGNVLFNLGIAYSTTDKKKAIDYLEKAKKVLPTSEKEISKILEDLKK